MKEKNISVKTLGIEYFKVISGFTKKAIKENPDMSFISFLSFYDCTSKDDVRQLTGLNEKEYHKVFSEIPEDNMRYVKSGSLANETLLKHLDKPWLTEGQHLVSSLIWKYMQLESLNEISDQFELITEDRLEDVCPQYFKDDRYKITLEELNDAVILSMDTLHSIFEKRS